MTMYPSVYMYIHPHVDTHVHTHKYLERGTSSCVYIYIYIKQKYSSYTFLCVQTNIMSRLPLYPFITKFFLKGTKQSETCCLSIMKELIFVVIFYKVMTNFCQFLL